MRRASKHGRAFLVTVGIGALVEAAPAWLAYTWAARVLPCRFSPAQRLFGRNRACPVPIEVLGHGSFVPAVLLGALVVSSAAVFVLNLAATMVATYRARRAVVRRRFAGSLGLDAPPRSLGGPNRVVVIADDVPSAYCIGLLRPAIVVSTGLVQRLSAPQLQAVLAHEASHCRLRDPLRAAVARGLARALFFVPALMDLAEATLAENEISADAAAITSVGRASLVTALWELLGQPARPGGVGMVTERLLRSRIEALESGRRPAVQVPLVRSVISAALIATLLATGAWMPHYRRPGVVRSVPTVTSYSRSGGHSGL